MRCNVCKNKLTVYALLDEKLEASIIPETETILCTELKIKQVWYCKICKKVKGDVKMSKRIKLTEMNKFKYGLLTILCIPFSLICFIICLPIWIIKEFGEWSIKKFNEEK